MTIMQGLDEAGIDKAAMACKLMSSGFDGASVTQGQEGGVRALIRELVPFGLGIWCYAHRLNLASEPLSKQKLVGNLEVLARSIGAATTTSLTAQLGSGSGLKQRRRQAPRAIIC